MVVRELITLSVVILIVIIGIVGVSSQYVFNEKDGQTEEFCEAVIEQQLGLPAGTIDLSPDTPEEENSHG